MSYGLLYDQVWGYEHPYPIVWEDQLVSKYEIICYEFPKYEPEPCPGESKCHGCRSWCDWCGNVRDVCDAEWPYRCDTHERYPEPPPKPESNPNQLIFPGFGV